MKNKQNEKEVKDKKDEIENKPVDQNFPQFTCEIIADIILGIILGISVNLFADFVGRQLNLPAIVIILFQIFLISTVFYLMKNQSNHLYKTWHGQMNYGIVFIAVFLSVQKNMTHLFDKVYIG